MSSANTLCSPLFTVEMYESLGIHWASSIPAFLSLACVPFPFLFYKYGAQIRARCVYSAKAEAAMRALQQSAASNVRPEKVPAGRPEDYTSSDETDEKMLGSDVTTIRDLEKNT